MNFQKFTLHPQILKSIEELGFTTPTPIQNQAIPKILEGKDLRASAQTGTGKTAAFLLPTLSRLAQPSSSKEKRGPRILILVPTRELAIQVAAEAVKYSKHLSQVKTVCIYGGAPYPAQNRELSRPYEILVATPGRLIDHLEQGRIHFSRLETFILDEADRMLDMGFIHPVKKIAASMPKMRQTLMFSATLKGSVIAFSKFLLKDFLEISIDPDPTNDQMQQQLYLVDSSDHKYSLLQHFFSDSALSQVLIFTATKYQANQLSCKLSKEGHLVAALHGNMNQRQRIRAMNHLREGKIRILVATDVASRGIDVLSLSHVINFDMPQSPEDYIHRIGRTARAGKSGIALSFAMRKDFSLVRDIERFIMQKIPVHLVPGLEPKIKAFAPQVVSKEKPRHRLQKKNKKRFWTSKRRHRTKS